MDAPTPAQDDAAGGLARPSLASAAAIVAAGFLLSRLLGVGRSIAIADTYGTSSELSAYWVAFRLPDLVFQLLAGATLGSAFIPTFARLFTKQSEEAAWRLARSVLNLVFIATIVVAVLGFLLAPVLVPAMAPGLGEDTGQQEELRSLAVNLTRIMLISPVLFSVSGMFMGILNARHHFLMPALAPALYNIAIIIGALVSHDVHVLAWAVVIGAALHLVVQIPALASAGMRFGTDANWRDPDVREVGRLMAPRVIGLAAFQFNLLITIFFASTVSDEAIAGINYAWLITLTPLALFGMAISTAVFPTMAEQAADNLGELRWTLEQSLRLILFLTLPAAAALMILSEPLVTFFFQRGEFSAASTEIVQSALVYYAIGLFALAAIEILSRAFYALSDTATPVRFAVIALAVNLVLSATLVHPLEVRGLALSVSIATIVEAVLLFWTLRGRVGDLDLDALAMSVGRTLVAVVLMVEAITLYFIVLDQAGHFDMNRTADAFFALAGSSVIGTAVFAGAARALGSQELETVLRRVPFLARFAAA